MCVCICTDIAGDTGVLVQFYCLPTSAGRQYGPQSDMDCSIDICPQWVPYTSIPAVTGDQLCGWFYQWLLYPSWIHASMVSVCPSGCLSVCLYVCLSVCLSVYLYVCMSVMYVCTCVCIWIVTYSVIRLCIIVYYMDMITDASCINWIFKVVIITFWGIIYHWFILHILLLCYCVFYKILYCWKIWLFFYRLTGNLH